MRVHELAKEYGIKSTEFVDTIQSFGYDIKSHLSTLDGAQVADIRYKIRLIDENFTIKAVNDSEIIKGEENTLFSLMAMPEARVSVTGARWNLKHEKLEMSGRGVHNEIGTSGKVTIECHSGNLLLIEGNFVLPHD